MATQVNVQPGHGKGGRQPTRQFLDSLSGHDDPGMFGRMFPNLEPLAVAPVVAAELEEQHVGVVGGVEPAERLLAVEVDKPAEEGFDGDEVTARILADRPDARVVVLTTYENDDSILRAIGAGAPPSVTLCNRSRPS